ncbi:MAG: glycosyltransferase family 4 protein [Anaerolineae bacterium]|nr:glycosyltransferase family 4 protein [Anaerolineae bacterium]MBT3714659.1 glycosyltransferase family 4 protein [Anaerolineae bacterium]MBT4308825.1 glycosyltransferase family 4 protein [Anaerolineae bacterium]MBT4457904.1 glycosyltransferase family 4 protein [Anaerolineae bacterium]MBT4842093.1 glycosyltransferase family 4 protein [Anaerolineae bacterium]
MKIGISTRGLDQGSYAISMIILQLTRKIIELAGSKHEIFLYCNDPQHEEMFTSSAAKHSFELNNRFIWDQIWLPQALKKDRIDIALFMKGTMPLLLPCRGAVIFHDLGYFDNQLRPYRSFETVYMKAMMFRAAKKACKVFADSEYTRRDAIRIFDLDPEKTSVCYQNCSPIYQPVRDQIKRKFIRDYYDLPAHFMFSPTSLSPRKNISRILAAFDVVKDNISHDIVITGGQSWGRNELAQYKNTELSKRIHILGTIPYEEMPGLYSLADFTLFPSLLEGFGLPVLESFRCDCPILTSDITSLPEVAGDAAYLVDPYSIDEIATGMIRLGTDFALRQRLIVKGREQAKKFSWERTAQTILDKLEVC